MFLLITSRRISRTPRSPAFSSNAAIIARPMPCRRHAGSTPTPLIHPRSPRRDSSAMPAHRSRPAPPPTPSDQPRSTAPGRASHPPSGAEAQGSRRKPRSTTTPVRRAARVRPAESGRFEIPSLRSRWKTIDGRISHPPVIVNRYPLNLSMDAHSWAIEAKHAP